MLYSCELGLQTITHAHDVIERFSMSHSVRQAIKIAPYHGLFLVSPVTHLAYCLTLLFLAHAQYTRTRTVFTHWSLLRAPVRRVRRAERLAGER